MGGVGHAVLAGPLILAVAVAVTAGAVTFLSPCVLPLVPGYLSYVTGMAGMDAQADSAHRRTVTGAVLFVLGFSVVFATEGVLFGGLGAVLRTHTAGLTRLLGVVTIILGLLFAGVFDRFAFAGRIVRPSVRPRAGLASAPALGFLFGLSWTPCIGPTLSVVLGLALTSGTAARGAMLMFAYSLGLGIPFVAVAMLVQRGMTALAFARRHARLITRLGGAMLVAVGVLELTGVWTAALQWMQTHWITVYRAPL